MGLRWRKGALGQVFVLLAYSLLSYLSLSAHNAWMSENTEEPPPWASRVSAIRSSCASSAQAGSLPTPSQLKRKWPAPQLDHFTRLHQNQILSPVVRVAKLGLDWCLVPKVASSSISHAFLPFLPPLKKKPTSGLSFIQKEVWDRAGRLQWEEHAASPLPALLVARHPFARVASAFRNKLEDRGRSHDGEYFYTTYSKQIIKHARGSWSPSDSEPTFSEVKLISVCHLCEFKFADWLLNIVPQFMSWLVNITPQFVNWLLDEDLEKWDEHWMPVSLRCRVCQLPFRYVIKYENLAKEWPHLLNSLGVSEDERTALQLPWENRGLQQGGAGGGGSLKEIYMDKLPTEIVDKLFDKLAADFAMFGYTIEDEF